MKLSSGPVAPDLDQPDNEAPVFNGPKLTPQDVADGIVAALGAEGFELMCST